MTMSSPSTCCVDPVGPDIWVDPVLTFLQDGGHAGGCTCSWLPFEIRTPGIGVFPSAPPHLVKSLKKELSQSLTGGRGFSIAALAALAAGLAGAKVLHVPAAAAASSCQWSLLHLQNQPGGRWSCISKLNSMCSPWTFWLSLLMTTRTTTQVERSQRKVLTKKRVASPLNICPNDSPFWPSPCQVTPYSQSSFCCLQIQ